MNLNAYDPVNPIFKDTWIIPANRKLYSYTFKHYNYYTFLTRFDNNAKSYDYFIAMSNYVPKDDNRQWYSTYYTNSKAVKIDLNPIWSSTRFSNIRDKQEIITEIDYEDNDGIVYFIDI